MSKEAALNMIGWPVSLILRNETVWKFFLRMRGARGVPQMPLWDSANTTLKSRDDVESAARELHRIGLFPHPDRLKNWDSLAALAQLLRSVPTEASVLDAGSALYSPLLPWLYLYGYRRLIGINTGFLGSMSHGPIRYEKGDITQTRFGDAEFDAVTCLSVIEHGVDIAKFLGETRRILKPGGILVISTDYWPSAIDTGGRKAYGADVRILNAGDIEDLCRRAKVEGLDLVGPLELDASDPVVKWKGIDFTFLSFTLVKVN